jgi:3-hydroxyacyl-[acyl-carrier-protein] dehydratase
MNKPYSITLVQKKENILTGLLQFNKDHVVFKHHFPGNPIVPGAILLQIIREVLEKELNSKLQLTGANEIKFLKPIVPSNDLVLAIRITLLSENEIKAEIKSGNNLCFKMNGCYSRIN